MSEYALLAQAAKAAGYHVTADRLVNGRLVVRDGAKTTSWNPLEDDGDALRLAVKLRITPHIDGNLTDAESTAGFATEPHFNDPYAATRRAIVRAAAELATARADS